MVVQKLMRVTLKQINVFEGYANGGETNLVNQEVHARLEHLLYRG